MKKVFAVLLSLNLLLSLAACSGVPNGTTGNIRPEELLAGRYMIYEVRSPSGIKNLFQLDINGQSDSYVQLYADGSLAGSLMGESVKGARWELSEHTITVESGECFTFTLEDGLLTVTVRETTLLYLREGDPRLEDIPTPLTFLHSYIWGHGQQEGMDRLVVCSGDFYLETVTMIATEEGEVIWKLERSDGSVVEMTLEEGAKSQTVTMNYHGDRCKATFSTADVQENDVRLSGFRSLDADDMVDFYEDLMREAVRTLLSNAQAYLEKELDLPMSCLGFVSYKQ